MPYSAINKFQPLFYTSDKENSPGNWLNIFNGWAIKPGPTLVQQLGERDDTMLPLQPASCVTVDKSFHSPSFGFIF